MDCFEQKWYYAVKRRDVNLIATRVKYLLLFE